MRTLPMVVISLVAACAAPSPGEAQPSTVKPVPRDEGWHKRVEGDVAAARAGGHRLVFVGDSITQSWRDAGKEVWREVWEPRHALNLGISGDRTQHVLWRLDHGQLAALAAPNNDVRACVVMIGTNNSNRDDHTAEDIADGIVAVVRRLRGSLPKAKVLLLAIFPRGEHPSAQGDKCAAASRLAAAAFAGDDHVACRDIGARFLSADGSLPKAMMPDYLHLSAGGYRAWADAIVADVDALLR